MDAAGGDSHQGAELEQLQPDGRAGRGRELGMREADPAQRAHQHVGGRGEP